MDQAKKIKQRAFKEALDTRKFEIDLYWKRARYFFDIMCVLGGISAILTIAQSAGSIIDEFLWLILFVIGCVGTVTAVAWYLTNKGSKYWQENWEQYVDALGKEIVGPLFEHPISADGKNSNLTRYSVSKVNELLSLYAIWVWGLLTLSTLIIGILLQCRQELMSEVIMWIPIAGAVILLIVSVWIICRTFKCKRSVAPQSTDDEPDKHIRQYFLSLFPLSGSTEE